MRALPPEDSVGALRPLLLPSGLALLALALGTIGYRAADGDQSPADALYQSLQLFALEGGLPRGGTPWQLNLARFLAPAVVAYAAFLTLASVLREEATRMGVRLRARRHTVVVGLGHIGTTVAREQRRSRRQVVAVERDPHVPGIATARAGGVQVLNGDGTSALGLARAHVARASQVVLATGSDAANLAAAATAQDLLRKAGSSSCTVHVLLHDVALWREVGSVRLDAGGPVRLEYVNLLHRRADVIVDAAAEQDATGHLDQHLLVDGDSELSVRVVVQVLRRAARVGRRARLCVTSADHAALVERLRQQEPWCLEHADLHPWPSTTNDALPAPTVAIVCSSLRDDAGAVARGLNLLREQPQAQVVVPLHVDGIERALLPVASGHQRLHLAPATSKVLGRQLLGRSTVEVMARARHETYLDAESAKGDTSQNNPSLVPWSALPESLRESNRRFAQAATDVLGALGAELKPLAGPAPVGPLALDALVLERLAEAEHERWMRDLIADGWRATAGSKDSRRKRHPLLVPWEQLDEVERQKDRDAVLHLPVLLGSIGYELVLPNGAGA